MERFVCGKGLHVLPLHLAQDTKTVRFETVRFFRQDILDYALRIFELTGLHEKTCFFERVCGKVPKNNNEMIYQRELARMIFYGIVARVFSNNPNGVKFDYVPIFESGQGKGKSTLVSRLNILPSTYDVVDSFDGRDAMLHLSGKCFMEIAELQAMNKAKDNETIKKFVTKATDTFRLPYGRSDVTYVRT